VRGERHGWGWREYLSVMSIEMNMETPPVVASPTLASPTEVTLSDDQQANAVTLSPRLSAQRQTHHQTLSMTYQMIKTPWTSTWRSALLNPRRRFTPDWRFGRCTGSRLAHGIELTWVT